MLKLFQLKKLDAALKVLNQRIAEIGKAKQFGKNSNVYKQVIGTFETKDLQKYIGTSKSGNFKFNIRAINKALKDGKPHPELEKIINAAGFREGKPGFLKKTKEGKAIPRVRDLMKKWKKLLDPNENKTDSQLKEEINTAVSLSDDFRSLIYEFQDTFGNDTLQSEFPELFGKGRGKLNNAVYQKIRGKMIRELVKEKQEERRQSVSFVDGFKNL